MCATSSPSMRNNQHVFKWIIMPAVYAKQFICLIMALSSNDNTTPSSSDCVLLSTRAFTAFGCAVTVLSHTELKKHLFSSYFPQGLVNTLYSHCSS